MPRKPTEKQTSEERAEKNQRNASRSCHCPRNSYKHGFRAEMVVPCVEAAERLKELRQEWEGAYQPRTPEQRAALDRCVDDSLMEVEEGVRLVRYLRKNDTGFHRNLKQLDKGDQRQGEEAGDATTCDQGEASPVEATNKATVPEKASTNKATVPEKVSTNKATAPEKASINKAKHPEVAAPGRATVESSTERNSEVSTMATMPKSLAVPEVKRCAVSFARPDDQVGSGKEWEADMGLEACLSPGGGAGGSLPSSLTAGG